MATLERATPQVRSSVNGPEERPVLVRTAMTTESMRHPRGGLYFDDFEIGTIIRADGSLYLMH